MSNVENALYVDPRLVDLYDLLNSGDWDYRFYAEQIGVQRQNILDLGCGTGTFALRLTAAGHEVTAIDPAPTMIDHARRRSGANAVEWIVGDASCIPGHAQFDVVTMTGHAFQCLLTDDDIVATLRIVREAIGAEGRFMFETRNPFSKPWIDWTPDLSIRSIQSDKHGPVDVFHECIAEAESLVEFETHYVFHLDGTEQISKSRLRFMSGETLKMHIYTAGFRACELYGDWNGEPFEETSSKEIIAICHV